MTWLRHCFRGWTRGLLLLATILLLLPVSAKAEPYGSGNYSAGPYGAGTSSSGSSSGTSKAASPSSGSTVVQTPSGLQVAINLADGQVLPATGYTVTITPLNGQGKTFTKAEIYIDDRLIFTGTPDQNGTLTWFWDTQQYPGKKIKIIVYDENGVPTTHEFTVQLTPAANSNPQSTTPTSNNGSETTANSPWFGWYIIAIAAGLLFIGVLILLIVRRLRRRDYYQE